MATTVDIFVREETADKVRVTKLHADKPAIERAVVDLGEASLYLDRTFALAMARKILAAFGEVQ